MQTVTATFFFSSAPVDYMLGHVHYTAADLSDVLFPAAGRATSPQSAEHNGSGLPKPPRVPASSHQSRCVLGEVNCGELLFRAGGAPWGLEGGFHQ